MKNQAVGYIRVSSTGQATEGVSLDAQRSKLRAWADLNDRTLVSIEGDGGKSGGRADNRKGLQRAIEAACERRCPLVVYSLSRMARSTRDATDILERLRKAGAQFVSISESIDTTSAAGRMFFAMLAAFAAFEREVGGERTAAALKYLKAQGKQYSRIPPMGYEYRDGALVESPTEQQALSIIRASKANGLTLRAIRSRLVDAGCVGRSGGPWSLCAIGKVA